MNEQQPDIQTQVAAVEERKPAVFAVRIDQELREQIEGLRGITGQSVNDLGVEALEDWVTKKLSDEDVRTKAMAEIDAEEQRLKARRNTIAGILGTKAIEANSPDEASPEASTTSRGGRRGKATP